MVSLESFIQTSEGFQLLTEKDVFMLLSIFMEARFVFALFLPCIFAEEQLTLFLLWEEWRGGVLTGRRYR